MQRIPLVAVGSPLLATGGVALAALAWRDRFPAGVASHVGPGGLVDDVTTPSGVTRTTRPPGMDAASGTSSRPDGDPPIPTEPPQDDDGPPF